MRKIYKVLIGAGIALALILALLIAIPFFVDLNRFIPEIESAGQKALKRELKLEGIKLSLITGPGVKLTGLKIASRQGLDKEPFVSVREIDVRVAVLPLLKNMIVVRRVALLEPKIILEKSAQGKLSISDLMPKPGEGTAPKPEAISKGLQVAGRRLEITGASIKNGKITFTDYSKAAGAPSVTEINNLNALVRDLSQDKPVRFELSFCPGQGCAETAVTLAGKIGPLGKELNFKTAPIEATAEFDSLQLTSVTPYLGSTLPVQILSGALSGKVSLAGNLNAGAGEAKLEIAEFSFTDRKKSWEPSPKTKVTLDSKLKIDLEKKIYLLEQAKLAIGKSLLELTGKIESAAYQFEVTQGSLDMAELAQIFTPLGKTLAQKGATLTGQAILTAKVSAASPLKFQTNLDLKDTGVNWPGLLNKNPGQNFGVNLAGRKAQAGIDLEDLGLNFPGGAIKGRGNLSSDNNLNLDLAGKQLSIDKLAGWIEPLKSLPLAGSMDLAGNLNGKVTDTKDLGFKIDNLAIQNPDMDLTLKGTVKDFSAPKIRFEGKGNRINLDKLFAAKPASPAPAPTAKPAEKTAPAATAETGSALKNIDVEGKLNCGQIEMSGYQFNDVQTNVNMKNGVLSLGNDSIGVFKGLAAGPVKADLTTKKMATEGNIDLSKIDLQDALAKFTTLAKTMDGKLDGNIQFKTAGTSVDEIERTLSAKGQFALKDGSLKTLDIMGSLLGEWVNSSQFRDFLQKNVGKKEWAALNQTKFDLATGVFEIKDGQVLLNNVAMNVPDGKITGVGKFGFDYKAKFEGELVMNEKASKDLIRSMGLAPDQAGWLLRDGKNLWLPFGVSGKYPELKVSLDTNEYWKAAQDNLKKGVEKALKSPEAKQFQEDLQKEAQKQLENLFKGIAPKSGDKKKK